MDSTTYSDEKKCNIRLGALHYDSYNQCLFSERETVYLRNKLNDVLNYMIVNQHRAVSRNELVENIWRGNFYTGVKAVTHSVCKLRKTFSELGEDKVSIKTLPKQGYALQIN